MAKAKVTEKNIKLILQGSMGKGNSRTGSTCCDQQFFTDYV